MYLYLTGDNGILAITQEFTVSPDFNKNFVLSKNVHRNCLRTHRNDIPINVLIPPSDPDIPPGSCRSGSH